MPLGEALEGTTGGGTPKRSEPRFWEGEIPWASVKDFRDGGMVLEDTEESITLAGLNASSANLIQPGTPIVCQRMAVGRVAVPSQPTAINQDLRALELKEDFDPRFLAWYLQYSGSRLAALATGTTVKGLRIADLERHRVPVVEFPEQRRIAHVLDTADAAIRRTETVTEKLEQVKQGLLHDLLTRGLDEEGRLRPPPEEAPMRYGASRIGSVPDAWDVMDLGSVIVSGPRNGLYKPKSDYHPDGVPIIRISGFRERHRFDLGRLERVQVTPDELGKYQLQKGDILINRVNSIEYVGISAAVPSLREKTVYESNFMRCRVDEEIIRPEFLGTFLQSPRARSYFKRTARPAVHQASVNQGDVEACPIPVPSINEQDAILARRKAIEDRLQEERASFPKLQNIKIGLMQDILTGRVRVPEKIRTEEGRF